jgi:hypothetical protein
MLKPRDCTSARAGIYITSVVWGVNEPFLQPSKSELHLQASIQNGASGLTALISGEELHCAFHSLDGSNR